MDMKINDADNDLRDTDSEFLSGKVLDMPQGVPSRAREGRVVYVPAWPDGKNYPNGYIQMATLKEKKSSLTGRTLVSSGTHHLMTFPLTAVNGSR